MKKVKVTADALTCVVGKGSVIIVSDNQYSLIKNQVELQEEIKPTLDIKEEIVEDSKEVEVQEEVRTKRTYTKRN